MRWYKLTAEHFTRKKGERLIQFAETEMNLDVSHAGMDDTFSDHFNIVVQCTPPQMVKLRNKMWELNRGAYCAYVKDWTEEMDPEASWL